MTLADLVILALVALMALQGFLRGFIVGAAALAGFVAGGLIGSRIAPVLLSGGAHSPYSALISLGGAVILGGLLGSIFEGVARRLRRFMWIPGLRILDGILGALLTAGIGLGMAWIAGAVLLQASSQFGLPPSLRHSIARSVILRSLNRTLPPSGPILNALGRIDPLGSIAGSGADVPPPNPRIVAAPGVRLASSSVVRILGTACGFGVEGSGWVAGNGLVVTNAHVVAGETDTVVQVRGVGPPLAASTLVFDPHNDVAVLRVPALTAPALRLASGPASGESAALLGFPLNHGYDRQPARLGPTRRANTTDAYGNPASRLITTLRGWVRSGNSGGPLVDALGQVVGTVFAEITNAAANDRSGLAVPNRVVAHDLRRALTARHFVSTRSCAD
ncbi:MAG TPA: MarP family serine protease [Solirubrobacteraceae bacterium]|nr:MarP family serine protease [Solirubrobacteraceae bacterium]